MPGGLRVGAGTRGLKAMKRWAAAPQMAFLPARSTSSWQLWTSAFSGLQEVSDRRMKHIRMLRQCTRPDPMHDFHLSHTVLYSLSHMGVLFRHVSLIGHICWICRMHLGHQNIFLQPSAMQSKWLW